MCVVAGIEPHGNKVLHPAVFTVDTLEAGSGEVLVYVEDPEGHTEEVSAEFDHSGVDENGCHSVQPHMSCFPGESQTQQR